MDKLIDTLVTTAERWQEPGHGPRARAIEASLACDNRFTVEAIAFAIDQQMSEVTRAVLVDWVEGRRTGSPSDVGVLNAGNVPLAGFQDFLAVLLTGHRYIGVVSSKSPYLLPAFVNDAGETVAEFASFTAYEDMMRRATAVIATGSEVTGDAVMRDAREAGIVSERLLIRGHRYAIAVIDGQENDDEWDGLAEDALLHEGLGCRNIAIVFAPNGTSPDPFLDALARFRGVFPAHERTPGALQIHRAMLAAVDQPHAYGDGLEFLMSKGDPEPQLPGHIRWTEYTRLAEISSWIDSHASEIQLVVARPAVSAGLGESVPVAEPGQAQRPSLTWRPDGTDQIGFLASL